MAYFVCGFRDTRREFSIQGVTTSKAKADKWVKDQNKKREGQQNRDWPEANETPKL